MSWFSNPDGTSKKIKYGGEDDTTSSSENKKEVELKKSVHTEYSSNLALFNLAYKDSLSYLQSIQSGQSRDKPKEFRMRISGYIVYYTALQKSIERDLSKSNIEKEVLGRQGAFLFQRVTELSTLINNHLEILKTALNTKNLKNVVIEDQMFGLIREAEEFKKKINLFETRFQTSISRYSNNRKKLEQYVELLVDEMNIYSNQNRVYIQKVINFQPPLIQETRYNKLKIELNETIDRFNDVLNLAASTKESWKFTTNPDKMKSSATTRNKKRSSSKQDEVSANRRKANKRKNKKK